MTVRIRPSVERYYDLHPTEEDLMGYSALQAAFVLALIPVLKWLFRAEGWFIALDLNIYRTDDFSENPIAPDLAVFKGVVLSDEEEDDLRSWRLAPPERPAPAIVFEVASKSTWEPDLEEKPAAYGQMGVREYVYYDPRRRRPRRSPKMRVWRYQEGIPVELPANEQGWVWSEELESWLAPDGKNLRLYDRGGNIRPSEAEVERAEKEAERAEKEAERAEKERLLEILRQHGIEQGV